MRVRIVQNPKHKDYYRVESWKWWWPFWINHFRYDEFLENEVVDIAKRLVNPVIVEFHK